VSLYYPRSTLEQRENEKQRDEFEIGWRQKMMTMREEQAHEAQEDDQSAARSCNETLSDQ
jgi:hypothetical protein